jgi:hypothetical protein
MLQESQVEFEIAEISRAPVSRHASDTLRQMPSNAGQDDACTAIAPAPAGTSSITENQTELRDLRRDGEKVLTPDEIGRVKPPSTALLFEGAWRVHGLLDVMRQFLLSAPLPSAPIATPVRLPRLIAPKPFTHAAVHSADIVKSQTRPPTAASPSNTKVDERHTVELSGCFFPNQVQRLLELLSIPLASFTCRMACDPRHSTGINAFTQLGMYRLEGICCERPNSERATRDASYWEFELAGG